MKQQISRQKAGGRAVFLHRDSGGRHETTPGEYVRWAIRVAQEKGLKFDGRPETIDEMIRRNESVRGDIFLDFGISGNELSRPGLNALIAEVQRDTSISHVLIPKPNRLARPNDPLDGVKLEGLFVGLGVNVVYQDGERKAIGRGGRRDIAEVLMSLLAFDHAGKDRTELARSIIQSQISLARGGFTAGGRPPYGWRRHLVKDNHEVIRELADGERVRMPGHHVVWLPTAEDELGTRRRIIEMAETLPVTQIAKQLNKEGIPSPASRRYRIDNGVQHPVSGVWHATTISNIIRDPLNVAMTRYGLRSMGDCLRFDPDGPRQLNDADFSDVDKPKVIRNDSKDWITCEAKFDPIVDKGIWQTANAVLDQRGRSQRGKPRSRRPDHNPLGCRIYDMNCGWPMYRAQMPHTFDYRCGKYVNTHGSCCDYNHVNGPQALAFGLACVRQQVLSPVMLAKLRLAVKAKLGARVGRVDGDQVLEQARAELRSLQNDADQINENLARAATAAQYKAVAKVFEAQEKKIAASRSRLADLEQQSARPVDLEREVEVVMKQLDECSAIVAEPSSMRHAKELFCRLNLRMFLKFDGVKKGRRVLRRLTSGVVTFGDAPTPVPLYGGDSEKTIHKENAEHDPTNKTKNESFSNPEENSLRNVNRGGSHGIETMWRKFLDAAMDTGSFTRS